MQYQKRLILSQEVCQLIFFHFSESQCVHMRQDHGRGREVAKLEVIGLIELREKWEYIVAC